MSQFTIRLEAPVRTRYADRWFRRGQHVDFRMEELLYPATVVEAKVSDDGRHVDLAIDVPGLDVPVKPWPESGMRR